MKLGHLFSIVGFFLLVKFIQVLILSFIQYQFDTSSKIILNDEVIHSQRLLFQKSFKVEWFSKLVIGFLDKCVIWDAVYFTDLFINPLKYEHLFVFCPLWWRLIKYIPYGNDNDTPFYSKLLLGVIVSNLCHLFSCIVLYYLTSISFASNSLKSRSKNHSLSLKVALIYVISPAGVFLTAPYSESLCSLLTFCAMYLRELSIDKSNYSTFALRKNIFFKSTYLLSGVCVALAFGVRPNSLLLGYLYLYDLYCCIKNKSFQVAYFAIASGSLLLLSVLISTYYPYSVFCPSRGEWCENMVPSLFQYAQSKYWNVGFLSYWTPNNIPNFIFALPTIILTLLAGNYFTFIYPCVETYPIVTISRMLLIGGVFFWNVQILTRISSAIPLMYWYVGDKLVLQSLNTKGATPRASSVEIEDITGFPKHQNNKNVPWDSFFTQFVVRFFVVWIIVQTALFGAFLPPA